MKLKWSILAGLLVIIFGLQSCGGSASTPAPVGLSEEEQLGTAVAGTLTSAGRFPTATDTPAPTPTITQTPTRAPRPLRVVYSRAGSIWIWTEGGQPKQLTNNIVDAKPRLSDDGQWIVFERNNELYKVRSDGSDLKVLVSNDFLKPYIPSGYKFIWAEYYDWKLDTHYVYFTTKTGISGSGTDIFQFDLFRADVDTGEVRQILPPGMGGVPYFSPDGKTIALVQPTAIYLADTEGSGIRKALSFELVNTGSEWLYFPVAVSLQDGSGFRVLIPPHGSPGGTRKPNELWEVPNSGQASLLYSIDDTWFVGFRYLSPNAESIVYTKFDFKSSSQICVHRNGNTSDDCWSQKGVNGGFIGWAPDSIRYVTSDYNEEQAENFYLTDDLGNSIPINASHLMYWVDTNRYIYVDTDLNLYITSVDGDPYRIDKGIPQKAGKVDIWTWQFDFSH
jgi:hypothetical protein